MHNLRAFVYLPDHFEAQQQSIVESNPFFQALQPQRLGARTAMYDHNIITRITNTTSTPLMSRYRTHSTTDTAISPQGTLHKRKMQSSDEETSTKKARDDLLRNGFPACGHAFISELRNFDAPGKKHIIRALDWNERTFEKHARTIRTFLREYTGVGRAYFCKGPPTDFKRVSNKQEILVCRATDSNLRIWQLYQENKQQTRQFIEPAVAQTVAYIPGFLCTSPEEFLRSTSKLPDDIVERPTPNGTLRLRLAERLVYYHIDKMQVHTALRESRTEGQFKNIIHVHPSARPSKKLSPKKQTVKKGFSGCDLYVRTSHEGIAQHYVEIQRLVPEEHRTKVGGNIKIKYASYEELLEELLDQDLPFAVDSGYFEYHFADGKKALVDDTESLQNMLMVAKRDGKARYELVWTEGKVPPKSEHTML